MSSRKGILVALTMLTAVPAFAAVRLTYQLNGAAVPVSWPSTAFPIHYAIDSNVVAKIGSTEPIEHAFSDWTTVPDTAIAFVSNGVINNAKAGQDGVNTVSVADGLFAGQNFIALTTNWYDETAHIKESDIQVDPGALAGNYNVQQVVEHEVGHLLGLDHSAVLSSMMYPFVGLDGVPSLDSDDKIAMQMLYPRIDSGGAIMQGRVVGDGGGIYAAQVVAVNDGGAPVATVLTNQNGDFEMRGVPPGNYRLYAEPLDGPVDVRNLSGNWRNAKTTSFPTEFADGGSVHVDGGKVYGNLVINAAGTTQLNPKWVGSFDPGQANLSLNSTAIVLAPGETTSIAVAGDGFVSGMTTFDLGSRDIKRVSDFTYAGNYVYATFAVAGNAPPQSLVIFVKSGNQEAALTGGVRIASKARGRAVRH
jgi:matrixin/carboxypeptidase family protein